MTVGWIFEGDRDRFLAAHYPVPGPSQPSLSFRCPFCDEGFERSHELALHVSSSHAVKRPFLLIDGAEPAQEQAIRTRINPRSVELFDCSELSAGFDGEPPHPIQPKLLWSALGEIERGTVRIRLSNAGGGPMQPVVHEYRFRIVAPDKYSLAAVDQLCLRDLGTEGVNLARVQEFYEETRSSPAAEYAEALADYVRAILIKDGDTGTGVSGKLGHYREVQNRALNTLQAFNRPLARLICGLLRFNLNDFSQWEVQSGFGRLDRANSVLGPLAARKQRQPLGETNTATAGSPLFKCPVDDGTETVVLFAEQATECPRWGAAIESRFGVVAEQASLDPLDRSKIRALWAVAALRMNARASAQKALRLLDGDPTFGAWAAEQLASEEQ